MVFDLHGNGAAAVCAAEQLFKSQTDEPLAFDAIMPFSRAYHCHGTIKTTKGNIMTHANIPSDG